MGGSRLLDRALRDTVPPFLTCLQIVQQAVQRIQQGIKFGGRQSRISFFVHAPYGLCRAPECSATQSGQMNDSVSLVQTVTFAPHQIFARQRLERPYDR